MAGVLEEKIPDGLQATLNKAFAAAFQLLFERGSGLIEHTYNREKLDARRAEAELELLLQGDRAALRRFASQAAGEGWRNTGLSAAKGVGLGLLGIGLPDIPLFTALLLRGVYKIARCYGYGVDSPEERQFILLLLQTALTSGEEFARNNARLNQWIAQGDSRPNKSLKQGIADTAEVLAAELLAVKFLQGLPLVGALGGFYDGVFQQRVMRCAVLKYNRRLLLRGREV